MGFVRAFANNLLHSLSFSRLALTNGISAAAGAKALIN